jgi:hypothetical protein
LPVALGSTPHIPEELAMAFDLAVLTRYLTVAAAPAADHHIRRCAHAAAVLIFGLAIAAAAVYRHIPKDHPRILLAIELAASGDEVRARAPVDVRAAVLRAQRDDSRLFIPAYWAVFSACGIVFLLSGGRIPRLSGWVVIAGVTIAALLDLRENALINAALGGSSQATPAPWGLAKWRLLFAVAAALSVPLLTRSRHLRLHANLTAVLFLAASVWGLASSVRDSTGGIQMATAWLAAGLFLLALLFLWDSGFFARTS